MFNTSAAIFVRGVSTQGAIQTEWARASTDLYTRLTQRVKNS